LVGKPEGKRPLNKPRSRWENNIRMDLSEIRWEGVDWMHVSGYESVAGCCEHGNDEPLGSIKAGNLLTS
jgi:hypothetical protein